MPPAYLQWQFHSGERVVARGPLVLQKVRSFSLLYSSSAVFSTEGMWSL